MRPDTFPLHEAVFAAEPRRLGNWPLFDVPPERWGETLELLRSRQAELLTSFMDRGADGARELLTWFAVPSGKVDEVVALGVRGDPLPTGAFVYPILAWYERRIHDREGAEFEGNPDMRPIVRHDHAVPALAAYSGLVHLPLGPVREAVVESGHYLFETVGEEIVRLGLRFHFKHRGIETMAEGMDPWRLILLAERIAGTTSVAHAVATAEAVEGALGIDVPERARRIRLLLQEGERIYNHVSDAAWLCRAAGLAVGDAEMAMWKEDALRANGRLTGSRYLRGVVAAGGLTGDLATEDLRAWMERLLTVGDAFRATVRALARTPTYIDRLEPTGRLSQENALALSAVGPVARASGVRRDARASTPTGAYRFLRTPIVTDGEGDALARYRVRVGEVEQALSLIEGAYQDLVEGPVLADDAQARLRQGEGCGLGWAESPRGRAVVWVRLKEGRVQRFSPRGASFHNWRAMPPAVPGNILTDFPLIEASYALSVAENDL